MPRINRAIRRRESPAFDRACTKFQVLMWGMALVQDGLGFQNAGEERQTWIEHRDELLKATEPGQRPVAFFLFDLGIKDRVTYRWFDQITVLLDRDLIGAEEAERVDHSYKELDPDQDALNNSFDTLEETARQQLSKYTLETLEGEFTLASRWHAWRGRPALAELYHLRSSMVHVVLEGAAA
jgi:hypothetical protein